MVDVLAMGKSIKQPKGLDRYNPRLRIATALIRKTGMPIGKALLKAGYSKQTSSLNGRTSPGIQPALLDAQEDFSKRYIKASIKKGYTPEYVVDRLKSIADRDVDHKDRSNAISSIREHNRVILRGYQTYKNTNPRNVTMHGVFVIPQQVKEDTWDKDIRDAEVIDKVDPPESRGKR